jgi:hypothetical protein
MLVKVHYIDKSKKVVARLTTKHEVALLKKPRFSITLDVGKTPQVIGYTKKHYLVKAKIYEGIHAEILIPKEKMELLQA